MSQLVVHVEPKPGLHVAASARQPRMPRQHEFQNLTSRLQESPGTPSDRCSVDLAFAVGVKC
jgi:hypothetical protein